MPGPEQPDKTSDKSSTQAGKLEKSAGERLSQESFPPPPKSDLSGDKGTAGTPADKFPQDGGQDTKVSDPGKTPPDKQDPSFGDKNATPPEKQPSKPPPSDFGSQLPEKQPGKQPSTDFGSHSPPDKQPLDSNKRVPPSDGQLEKPPPPAQSSDFGLPQKEPTDPGKKVPVADSPTAPRSPPSDTTPRAHGSDTVNAGNKPPVDQNTAARNAGQ